MSPTHSRAIDKELLGSSTRGIEVHLAVLQIESGSAVRLGVAGGIRLREVEHDAAEGGVEVGEVDVAGGAEGHEVKSGSILDRGCGRKAGKGGDDGAELHCGELKIGGLKMEMRVIRD